jgi:hypothetical protein
LNPWALRRDQRRAIQSMTGSPRFRLDAKSVLRVIKHKG